MLVLLINPKGPKASLMFLMRHSRPLFCLFSVFSNKQYIFYNKSMWKMSIQCTTPFESIKVFKGLLNVFNGPFPGSFFLYFRLFNTVDSKQSFQYSWSKQWSIQILPMTGFELRASCVGSDCSTNWTTTTVQASFMLVLLIEQKVVRAWHNLT